MGIKEFFNYRKRKNLYMFGAVALACSAMVWTRDIVAKIFYIEIIMGLDVATIVGALMIFGTYLFWKGELG